MDAFSPQTNPGSTAAPLLDVRHLCVRFPLRKGVWRRADGSVTAVDDVNFSISPGETFGLVGESGSGKTTVARAILRLVHATGQVRFQGQSVLDLPPRRLRSLRRHVQIIFQDPGGSLNPRMRVADIVGEPLIVHRLAKGSSLRSRVESLLERCNLHAGMADRYPHEFSGGERQRIAIARALALHPRLIICDEPTSSLDVSIQARILNLLKDLQDDFGLSYLFISHDLAVIHHMCDRIAVMHAGRIVEQGDRETVIRNPQHEYTQALLDAVPEADPRKTNGAVEFAGPAR